MKFGESGDWSTENAVFKVFFIDPNDKKEKQIGEVDLYSVTIPLLMWRVRLNSQAEVAYLITVTGHRSREIVVKITPNGSTNIFEVAGFDLLKEEVLDIDGDGIDELIFIPDQPNQGQKQRKRNI